MTTATGIYQPGEAVKIHTDLFPSRVSPLPPGVPTNRMIRTVITERALTVMWQSPQGVPTGRVDIEMTPEQTMGAAFNGGQVGDYFVERAGGCGCRGKAVKAVNPFPKNNLVQVPRRDQAVRNQPIGVPLNRQPTKFVRKRG